MANNKKMKVDLLAGLSVMQSFDESLLDSSSPSPDDLQAISDALTRFSVSMTSIIPSLSKCAQNALNEQIDDIFSFLDSFSRDEQ